MQHLLSDESLPPSMATGSRLAMQYSSQGSVTKGWLDEELRRSLGTHRGGALLQAPPPTEIVWPTEECVRCSLEGWAAGTVYACAWAAQRLI